MFETLFADAPEGSLIEFAFGTPPNHREWVAPSDAISRTAWPETHCYFGPAVRSRAGSTKDDVGATRALWVDVDSKDQPRPTLPPTFVVWSGHGWHLYWVLDQWATDRDTVERLNKLLAEDVDGDPACFNYNRLLRVPNTPNEDSRCELRKTVLEVAYALGDFAVLESLDRKTRHKVRTGDSRGYKSRSERDWAVVQALVRAGASDQLIELLFRHQPVGDKVRDQNTHETYLGKTIERARASPSTTAEGSGSGSIDLTPQEDGYYVVRGKASRRVSTFTIEPSLLLDGRPFGAEDAIVGDVAAAGYTWRSITFTRSAFTSIRSIDRETPIAAWQWLGRDDDVRLLLPYLMDLLRAKGLPKTCATSVLGLHVVGGRHLFVGGAHTLGSDATYEGYNGPLVYLAPRREHPKVLTRNVDDPPQELITAIATLLPSINRPETIWPLIGWYFATPFKPAFETAGVRFPILNVHGTKGSGKTTVIQRIMMPLLGQEDPKSYDANTTRFVVLAVLGSANAVPVAFSEFRFGTASNFLRYVLLAYDTGHDPRGRADQTTVDYPLSAPFSIDGEDLVADPAAKERIVAVTMHPADIAEDTDAYDAFQELRRLDLTAFGAYYIRHCLRWLDGDGFREALGRARRAMDDAFPQRLPDRVRNNYTVAYLGIDSFCTAAGIQSPPPASVLSQALRVVFDPDRGRAFVAADELVEDLCNAAKGNARGFAWDADGTHVYFQLGPAYGWWCTARRRAGRDALGKDAIRNQLKEVEYMTEPTPRNGVWMYGVDLAKARDLGLDVPDHLNPPATIEVHFQ